MKTTVPSAISAVLIVLLASSLIHCSEDLPTTNYVQAIELSALDGMITDKGFRGLVVAMASWCPPCKEELPILAKLYRKYQDKGIQIVAVSLDAEGPKAVQPLINKLEIPFPVYWIGIKGQRHYQIAGIPTTMIFYDGKLIQKIPGMHSQKLIEKIIKGLIEK